MQARLIFEAGPLSGQVFEFDDFPVIIGRTKSVAVSIPDGSVSREHARIELQGDNLLLIDLGSSNGTFVNNLRLKDPHILEDGDIITLGRAIKIRFEELQAAMFPETIVGDHQETGQHTIIASASVPETSGTETLIGESPSTPLPPQLIVSIGGVGSQVHKLVGEDLALGRASTNDIVISHQIISRNHAYIRKTSNGYDIEPLPEITNAIFLDGKKVEKRTPLYHGARLRVGGTRPGELVSLVYIAPDGGTDQQGSQAIQFKDRNLVTIGRDRENDIVLNVPTVSRFHAQVERVGRRYRINDLRSANGTFVNDQMIEQKAWLKPEDTVRIGPSRFVMGQDELVEYDEGLGIRVEAIGLNKWVRKDLNILQDISLVFEKREFIVVVGQSGSGKSSLVDAISGYRPATDGRVFVNGIDTYKNYDVIRNRIGFVPQQDIIHKELTVYQALDYAAQLRMPSDTTKEERQVRILEVLEELDLSNRQDVQISGLSGGQQKRVSIGVELLTKPGLFFLDEATSGLDPGTETSFMLLLRRLADQGRTIILITHATKNVMLADKIVFLGTGGHLTWFGPPEEALTYFDQYRTDRDRRTREIEFDEIYNLLDSSALGMAEEWASRFKEHQAYSQYIEEPLTKKEYVEAESTAPTKSTGRRQVSALRQLAILSARNLRILTRDRASLVLMLLTAPLIASMDFLLASGIGRNPFGFNGGDMNNIVISLIVMTNNVVMVGGLSQMRELVKERDIYRRERVVNLRLIPYILSKLWLAMLLSFYQAIIFVTVRYLAFEMPGGFTEALFLFISLMLLALAGAMLGLFASAVAPNANSVPLILLLLLIPQIVLSGALVPLPPMVTMPASNRWAFQAGMTISGSGSDLAADACWMLSTDIQELMTPEQKEENCRCMGVNALREDSCNFPGLGQFYDPSIDQTDPVKPSEIRSEPVRPELPAAPTPPENSLDQVATAQYLSDLAVYNEEIAQLQTDYETDLAAYRVERELYQVELAAYHTELAELQVGRAKATGSAEASIRVFNDDFRWSFADKEDDVAYYSTILSVWGAQVIIILVLLTGIAIMQKRRDLA